MELVLCHCRQKPCRKKKKGKPGAQEHGKDKKETQMQKVGRAAGRKEENRLKGEAQTEEGNGKERSEVGRQNNTSRIGEKREWQVMNSSLAAHCYRGLCCPLLAIPTTAAAAPKLPSSRTPHSTPPPPTPLG